MANYNYYEEAIQYALSRKVVLPADYYSKFTALQRSQSVSIAGLAQLNQIKHVIDAVNDSLATGKTFKDFQDAVRTGVSSIDLPEYRLDNIFRTNLQVAYNRGRWDQQERVALTRPYLMYSAINDSRTRPTHLALNGIILHRDDKFWLTHYTPLGYRCFLPDTKISGKIVGAARKFYEGKIIELTTQSRRKISITANHPILTTNGWVAAEKIRVTDQLLAYRKPVESCHVDSSVGQVNDDQSSISAENLFKTFFAKAFALTEAPTFELDHNVFVGNSEVNIDVLDNGLLVKHQPQGGACIKKAFFIDRNNAFPASSMVTNSPPEIGITVRDMVSSEYSANISSRTSVLPSKLTFTDIAGQVFIKNSRLQLTVGISGGLPSSTTLPLNATVNLFDRLPLDRFRLGLGSQDDSLFDELSSHGRAADFGLNRYLVNAHSSLVFLDPVIDVLQRSFSGHVYDFQSEEGLLSADYIIAHNCRCTTISLTEAQARKRGIATHIPQVSADKGWGHNVGEDYAGGVKAALEQFTSEFASQNTLLKPLIEKAHQTILANAEAALLPPVLPLVEVTEQHLKDLPDNLTDTPALKKLLLDKLRSTPPVFNANLNGYVEFYRGGIESALKTRSDLVRKLFLALPDILRYAVIDGFPEPNIKTAKKSGIEGYQQLQAKVRLDGRLYLVKLKVDIPLFDPRNTNTRGYGYYFHSVTELEA